MNLDDVPARFRPAVLSCAAGELPANVALMRLMLEAASEDELAAVLARAIGHAPDAAIGGRLRAVAELRRAHPDAFALVRRTIAEAPHDGVAGSPEAALQAWSKAFDRIASDSPDAGSALYALGSADLLARATAEIVAAMSGWGLAGPRADLLEIGCGSGRFLAALAPSMRSLLGLDISPGMVEAARRRCAGYPNVGVAPTSGRDLAGIAAESVDTVLAADVFPYLVAAGRELAEAHLAEAGRVLRPGGALLVLNYSYRGDPDGDASEIAAALPRTGLVLESRGRRDFQLWDAARFLIRKS